MNDTRTQLDRLAAQAKAGKQEDVEALWLAVEDFVRKKALHFYRIYRADHATEADDLIQAGYFAMLKALKTFDPTGGKSFTGWLAWYLAAEISEVWGYSRKRKAFDPTKTAESLNAPLSEDTDTTGEDMLADESAEWAMEQAEDRAFLANIRPALDRAVDRLPGKRPAVLRLRHYDRLTLQQAADRLCITRQRAQQLEREGLEALQADPDLLALCPALQFLPPRPVQRKAKRRKVSKRKRR